MLVFETLRLPGNVRRCVGTPWLCQTSFVSPAHTFAKTERQRQMPRLEVHARSRAEDIYKAGYELPKALVGSKRLAAAVPACRALQLDRHAQQDLALKPGPSDMHLSNWQTWQPLRNTFLSSGRCDVCKSLNERTSCLHGKQSTEHHISAAGTVNADRQNMREMIRLCRRHIAQLCGQESSK